MRRLPAILSIALLPLFAAPVQAAEADTQAIVDELRQLTERARQQRAADRWLQRALEDMVSRYDWPWRRELVFDDFSDGDFEQNPGWQAVNGRFWVSRERGLRSRVSEAQLSQPSAEAEQRPSMEAAILGALLDQAINKRNGNGGTADTTPSTGPNELLLNAPITNAFALETEFSLETPEGPGRLAFALLQGRDGNYGYRLRIESGRNGFVELERVRGGRASVVDGAKLATDPGDGGRHQLAWRQAPNGDVSVEMDGQPLFSVRDKAFRDGYQQLVLNHWSGDLTLHSIRVSGTE